MKKTKNIAVYFMVIFMIVNILGCQPTPDKEIVVRKDALEQSVASMTQQQEPFSAPETWQQEYIQPATGNRVAVDADVICPEFESINVIGAHPKNFTQEEVDKLIEYFVGDATLYNGEYQETKSDLEKKIIETQRIMAMTQEQRDAEFGGYTDEDLKNELDDLKARYAKAPETANNETVTSELTKDKDGFELLEVYAGDGGDGDALIEVYNLAQQSNSASFLIRLRDAGAGGKLLPLCGGPEETAQSVLDGLGIGNTRLYRSGQATASNDADNKKAVTRLFYERCVDGLPMRAVCGLIGENEMEYAAPSWRPDDISVDVGENGVTNFFWSQHGEITGTIKEDVALLPFEDIMREFEKSVFLQPIWQQSEKSDDGDYIVIDSIELCMAAVPRKDAQGDYLLVPAWNFYGHTEQPEFDGMDPALLKQMGLEDRNECFLTLSAADGTMLHR